MPTSLSNMSSFKQMQEKVDAITAGKKPEENQDK
jgi:hypothetical protein